VREVNSLEAGSREEEKTGEDRINRIDRMKDSNVQGAAVFTILKSCKFRSSCPGSVVGEEVDSDVLHDPGRV
jgi:hypothetical protein